MHSSIKTVTIDGRTYRFTGIDDADPYFGLIADGFESGFSSICRKLIRRDDVVLDIGANIGVTSAIMSSFTPHGMIYSFEPGQQVYNTLLKNMMINDVVNIYPRQVAVGNRDCKVCFNDQSAYGHISQDGPTVDCFTVDSLVREIGLQRVDFVKIDVEGNEAAVLDGAQNTISSFEPLFHIEFNSWTLVLLSTTHPRIFLERLFDTFKNIFSVKQNSDELISIRNRDGIRDLLTENFFRTGFVTDLLVTNSADRIKFLTCL